MNLLILNNGTLEEQKALYNNDTKEVIVTGDYYHNKIDEYIAGFIHGLEYCKNTVVTTEMTIYPKDELFDICNFYNDEYSDEENEDED